MSDTQEVKQDQEGGNPAPPPKIAHISASQLGMFLKCGEQYRRRYICGERIPPAARQIRGHGIHEARQVNLTQKMETKQDLPMEAVMQSARDRVVSEFSGEVVLEPGETIGGARDATVDQAVRLVACDYTHFQRVMVPTDVERKITVTVPGLGRDILGILDFADATHRVRDLKTVAKTPAKTAADTSDQLTTYALLYKAAYGRLPSKVQIDAVVDLKTGPKAVAMESDRTEDDMDMILRRYYAVIQAIDKGVFPPCPSDHWACSPRWCGYYHSCPYARKRISVPVGGIDE